jgi:hypothetical protein
MWHAVEFSRIVCVPTWSSWNRFQGNPSTLSEWPTRVKFCRCDVRHPGGAFHLTYPQTRPTDELILVCPVRLSGSLTLRLRGAAGQIRILCALHGLTRPGSVR